MQYISIVIVFVGLIKYSKSHKIYVYILSVLFATTFHSSAIVLLALIPLFKRHIPHVWWSFFIVLSYLVGRSGLLATVLNALNIGTLYDIYAVKEVVKFTLNGFILSTYIAFLIEIIDIDYIISVAVALGTIMMNLLAFNGDLARIHWYFSIFGIILFSHTKLKKKYMRMRSVIFIVSLMYGILVFWSFLLDNQSKIVPYTASFEL